MKNGSATNQPRVTLKNFKKPRKVASATSAATLAVIDMWYHLVETLRIEPKWVNLSETFSVESPLPVLRVVISGLFSSRKIEICKVNLA